MRPPLLPNAKKRGRAASDQAVKPPWLPLSIAARPPSRHELSKDVPPAKIKSPIVEAEIDRDWALKLNSKASPELSGSFKGGAGSGAGSSACDPNLMQSVQELKAQMDQAHNDSVEVQNATLQRIALLEAALTQTLKQVAVKLEEAAKRPQSFVVRQKRGMIVKNRYAPADP